MSGIPSSESIALQESTFRGPIRIESPVPANVNICEPPAILATRRFLETPSLSSSSTSFGTAVSAYLARFIAPSRAISDEGSITCASPATFSSGSNSVTPTQDPSPVVRIKPYPEITFKSAIPTLTTRCSSSIFCGHSQSSENFREGLGVRDKEKLPFYFMIAFNESCIDQ
ncbi:hypothetical protein D3C81_1715300 [compost metagenome]